MSIKNTPKSSLNQTDGGWKLDSVNSLQADKEKTWRPPEKISPLQQMVASCSGALITSLFVTPLDVVKIRLQSQQQPFRRGSCFIYHNGLMDHLCVCSYCTANGNGKPATAQMLAQRLASCPVAPNRLQPWYNKSGHFNGTMDAFVKIARQEGLPSLWSGLPPTLVMAVPATMVYFTLYDQLKYAMGFREGEHSTRFIPLLAGSTARAGAVTLISPLELIRTKMQSEQLSYRQVGVAVKQAIAEGGILSLWRGLSSTILRDVPFSAIYWFSYENTKSRALNFTGSTVAGVPHTFFAGAVSGAIAATVTTPFDVVKTQQQIELGQAGSFKRTRGTVTIMRQLYNQNGASSLFAGLAPRLLKVIPACAIMISSYEFGKAFFRTLNEEKAFTNR